MQFIAGVLQWDLLLFINIYTHTHYCDRIESDCVLACANVLLPYNGWKLFRTAKIVLENLRTHSFSQFISIQWVDSISEYVCYVNEKAYSFW